MNAKKNIFVVGLDKFNLKYLENSTSAKQFKFHELLNIEEVVEANTFDIPGLLKKCRHILNKFQDSIDAIVTYWDTPSVFIAPILQKEYGLIGPSLETVLKCEHKYWSRLAQSQVINEYIPRFSLINPFAKDVLTKNKLPYPFWLKPVKAHSSILGFRINNKKEFECAIEEIQKKISWFAEPFDHILSYANLPPEIKNITGKFCLAEEIISNGRQCTLEGYILNNQIEFYGAIDSIRGRNRSSFERYEYPSNLPENIIAKMQKISAKALHHLGVNQTPFNIEFFYNRNKDKIYMLEINTRISKSHSPLFEKVDGISNAEVMINVALGKKPPQFKHKGPFKHSAKFMPRIYKNGKKMTVLEAPDAKYIKNVAEHYPNTEIQWHAKQGLELTDLYDKDSYSYQIASIFMAANSHAALMKNYNTCLKSLPIRLGYRK